MKILVVEFPDGTDLSALNPGDGVSITKDATAIPGGLVLMVDGMIANPQLVAHTLGDHVPSMFPPSE